MNKKEPITEVFVDMDGVIADYYKRFKELFNDNPDVDYPRKKNTFQRRWDAFVEGENFATLDPMPDFDLALKFLRSLPDNVRVSILTSTAREEYLKEISRQKRIWLSIYNVEFHPIFVPGKSIKCYYARPGRVLIDDTASNIQQWNAHGGFGILHTSWADTIQHYNNLV
jgi:hypothetical protein